MIRTRVDSPTLVFGLALGLGGCVGASDGDGESGTEGTTATAGPGATDPSAGPSTASDPTADPTRDPTEDPTEDPTGDPTAADSSGGDPNDADAMCERWRADRADMNEGAWSGSVDGCDPGDIDAAGRDNTMRVLNLFRWLADLPPVTHDPALDAKGQQCALMMHANGQLSHGPTPDWTCYSADGAEAAGSSNIASTATVASVDLYMMDPGNPTTIGHRRWILSNSIGPTGLGSTDGFSCMWTLGGTGNAGAPWIAYPPPGPFPLEATDIGWTNLDETGWSIQSDGIDLAAAQVTVTRGGEVLPMTVVQLGGGYGSAFAISMLPDGWQIGTGEYHVVVTGISEPIEYDVEVVDCG